MPKHDTIDVVHVTEDWGDYIGLVLNGEQYKGTFDAFDFVVSKYFPEVTTELLTCSCGVAGCAGIDNGVNVKRKHNTVEWRDGDQVLPKEFYTFKKEAYDTIVEKTVELLREIAIKREAENLADDDRYDGILTFWSVSELEECFDRAKDWMQKYKV